MTEHLPVLIVVVPLLAGLFCLLLGRGEWTWLLTLFVTWAVFAACVVLLGRTLASPTGYLDYALGNWRPPWGIAYRIDPLNGFVLVVVSGIAAVVTLFARLSIASELPPFRLPYFYAAYLLCLTGLMGMTVTGDAFNLYVLLEISSLSTYTLVALGMERDRRALTASFRYLTLGTIGATFLLLGIGHLYMVTGTLNMADLHRLLADPAGPVSRYPHVVFTAFAFILVGVSLKVALFPLHVWLPNAYTYAPSAVTGFLAATATKVGAYVAFRFLFTVFGPAYSFANGLVTGALTAMAVLAILVASALAISQTNVKRLLAYSSVAQIGYIVLGLAVHNEKALTGAVVHLFNHAVMKGGLFLAVGALVYRLGGAELAGLRGLGRRMPFTAAAIVVGGASLVGIPLTAGFVSKWYLVAGCLEAGRWPLAVVVLLGSVLALYYVGRLVEVLYLRPPAGSLREAPVQLVVPVWVLTAATVVFGVTAGFTAATARRAAVILLGGWVWPS